METVTDLPFQVEETPHIWIPLSDGTRLSARIWKPVDAGPVPAILEYLPYRKRDGTHVRDALTHPYLAGHGYVCVRVDLRGTGDSEGLFDDEYSEQEQADGVEVINWLAAQDWCSGEVGMMGISWGGFNGLQIAARAPDPLKAVVSICATTDRFADDIHYKGGTMLTENPGWAATVLSWFSLPPDPDIVGDTWRDTWLNRLENTPFLAESWARHNTRDDYWRHGSVCEDYAAIKAAVLAVGGWHDGYRNTPAHLIENLTAPCRAIVGPWVHKYPHFAWPEPRIDFLGEMLRWWDHWLKGIDRGVMDDPPARVWLMDSVAPAAHLTERPGQWVAGESDAKATLHFADRTLAKDPVPFERTVASNAACGQATGEYFPFGFGPGEFPDDQRRDDALSLCFDSAPQPQTDITGAPTLRLTLSADQTHAQVIARLTDLRPDGTSAHISTGLLNLRHRDGHDAPRDVKPGATMSVVFSLDQIAYRLPAGHRLRVAISPSYWPFAFPSPQPVTLTISKGQVDLPLWNGADAPGFDGPKAAPPVEQNQITPPVQTKRLIHDLSQGIHTMEMVGDTGCVETVPTGLTLSQRVSEVYTISDSNPGDTSARFHWVRTMARKTWNVRTEAQITQRAQGPNFEIQADLAAWEGDTQVFTKSWSAVVPRG